MILTSYADVANGVVRDEVNCSDALSRQVN